MPDIETALQAIFRWFHVIAGITWIGHLYFFNFVNLPFQGGLAKELKPTVNPPLVLRALYFFRWGAMWTFAFGVVLFYLVYIQGGAFYDAEGHMSHRAMWVLLGGLLVSGVFVAYLQIAHKPGPDARPANWPRAWPWVIANGLLGPAFGVTCYQWALSTTPTSIVLPIVATTPLIVMPFAHYLEGDRITPRAVLGGALAVGGVVGLTLAR